MSNPSEKFYIDSQKHQLRITPQRVAIYAVLMNDDSHPTADTVYQKVKTTCPNISLDTVNRTLINFAELGMIDTVACSGQGKKYDPNRKPHHHLKCIACGKIIDFTNKHFDHIQIPADIPQDFTVLGKKVVITGRCKSCKTQRKGQS